jgi:hypothetical protein
MRIPAIHFENESSSVSNPINILHNRPMTNAEQLSEIDTIEITLHNYNYNCIQITPQQIPKPTK